MRGPIHEMTQNSQQREQLPFVLVSRHEKVTSEHLIQVRDRNVYTGLCADGGGAVRGAALPCRLLGLCDQWRGSL